jgi:hypothetical protein
MTFQKASVVLETQSINFSKNITFGHYVQDVKLTKVKDIMLQFDSRVRALDQIATGTSQNDSKESGGTP